MSISLSPRLLCCSHFVASGDRVADIGCDHGYLGIYLLKEGIASSVIAADINEGPLQCAIKNAEKYGVKDKMSFHLSDGAKDIAQDFDVLVCAGMGADTIISILEAASWLKSSKYRLILQCQSKTPALRHYLNKQGFRITEETVLRDGRFLYTVMEVYYEPSYPRLLDWECYFPPALLENPAPALPEYYRQVSGRLQRAIDGKGEQADSTLIDTLQALKALAEVPELRWLKEETL